MKNPITTCSLFITPKSTSDLQDYIEKLDGAEKVLAYTIAGMTWNLASQAIDEELANVNI
tara:strand:- start:76 stop:255 length:180 start_codon:yes stop_codon:yes gene_type:complete